MSATGALSNTNSSPLTQGLIPEVKTEAPPVLLVEDDHALRRYLQIILERSGFNVVTARDGVDAKSKFTIYRFAAIVSDAIMPRMDGYELCRFVRKHETLSNTPFILLSGLDHEGESSEVLNESNEMADVYLSKPVSPDTLVSHLGRLMPTAAYGANSRTG